MRTMEYKPPDLYPSPIFGAPGEWPDREAPLSRTPREGHRAMLLVTGSQAPASLKQPWSAGPLASPAPGCKHYKSRDKHLRMVLDTW